MSEGVEAAGKNDVVADPTDSPFGPWPDMGATNGEMVEAPIAQAVRVEESTAPTPLESAPTPDPPSLPERQARVLAEFPKGFEPLPQLLLYDDEINGDRLVRGVALDVRDIGGGLQVIMVKIREAVRMRRVVDGQIAEAAPKSIIAVPAIFDLVSVPAEMARDPVGDELGVLEIAWQVVDRFVAPGGVVVIRQRIEHRWVKGIGTRKDLLG